MSSTSDFSVTLVNAASGQSESLPVAPTTLLSELAEWACALFGHDNASQLYFFKDGKRLTSNSISLQAAGVQSGDVLAVQKASASASSGGGAAAARPAAASAASAGGGGGGGGLDFSSLLGGGGSSQPQQSSSSAAANGGAEGASSTTVPVYYPGMHLQDAMEYNPHPVQFCTLLREKEHLFKEFRYHNPQMAAKLQNVSSLEQAVQIWREELVRGGISQAMKQTTAFHERQDMEKRLQANPNDAEAKAYFSKQNAKQLVQQQYLQMMNEYPESLGRVLMLYIEAKINGHAIQAFCDTGAQMTIMSKKVATECGLADYIDERFSGMATGVGTGKILGRIHIVQLQIGSAYFPCSVSVMDDPAPGATEMPFLLGLDMMKRHVCQVNLQKGVLQFPMAGVDVHFLHEKDLSTTQGGTRDFDAHKANQELDEAMKREEEKDNNNNKMDTTDNNGNGGDNKDDKKPDASG